jgi:hypothetical protein
MKSDIEFNKLIGSGEKMVIVLTTKLEEGVGYGLLSLSNGIGAIPFFDSIDLAEKYEAAMFITGMDRRFSPSYKSLDELAECISKEWKGTKTITGEEMKVAGLANIHSIGLISPKTHIFDKTFSLVIKKGEKFLSSKSFGPDLNEEEIIYGKVHSKC